MAVGLAKSCMASSALSAFGNAPLVQNTRSQPSECSFKSQLMGMPLVGMRSTRPRSAVRSPSLLAVASNKKHESSEGEARELALESFAARKAFKVIAGLRNFDANNVADIVRAADQGGATLVDIACDPDLVRIARSLTKLPICVSAIEPDLFPAAVAAGAHMVEIGNYDGFYSEGRVFSAETVLELTRRTRELLPGVALSVTVPHTLPLDEQVRLAEALEPLCDVIQTEGGTSAAPTFAGAAGLIEKAAPTLAATLAISRAVRVPVMTASGISSVTAPLALASGASGIGVGSAINKLNSSLGMVAAVRAISEALQTQTQPQVVEARGSQGVQGSSI